MDSKLLFVLGFLLLAGVARADEYNDYEEKQNDEIKAVQKDETKNDEPQMTMEDMDTETSTALVQNDDPDSIKHKGFCHWGVAVWYKPGFSIRCSCMKCTCKNGGNWACAYEFSFCPYYYCGNQIYNPKSQLCCCGKVYEKKSHHSCCGYFYYDTRYSQCCNYYSVKSRKSKCPRHKI